MSIPNPYLVLGRHFSPKMTPFLPFFNNLNIFWTFWLLSSGFYPYKPRLRLLSLNGIFSIYHAEQPQPRFIWVKTTLKWSNVQNLLKLLKNGVILGPKWHHKAKWGLGTKNIISKYSIYHADQPPPGFIWVKTTLKWTKCQKTAQIVEKRANMGSFWGQNDVIGPNWD